MKTIEIPTDNPLEMIWAVREKIYEETKDMSKEEFGRLLQEHSEAFEKKLEKVRAERLAREKESPS